jgi:putative phosphoribosyl transferase
MQARNPLAPGVESAHRRTVLVPADGAELEGAFEFPARPCGLVIFAHGSGSSRGSPRNRFVAEALRQAGFATLLLDLLTEDEDATGGRRRFAIALLAERLQAAVRWAGAYPLAANLPLGLFGASTGAAAAIEVAAALGERIGAVVSRGGRPDLASPRAVARVKAPTLLIVGAGDHGVIEANEAAYARLACEKGLELVPGATHLFEEPGALEKVAELAAAWFARHLAGQPAHGAHAA